MRSNAQSRKRIAVMMAGKNDVEKMIFRRESTAYVSVVGVVACFLVINPPSVGFDLVSEA